MLPRLVFERGIILNLRKEETGETEEMEKDEATDAT